MMYEQEHKIYSLVGKICTCSKDLVFQTSNFFKAAIQENLHNQMLMGCLYAFIDINMVINNFYHKIITVNLFSLKL